MPEITIDPDICKKDGICVMTCPQTIFQQKQKETVPVLAHIESCIGCGHCVAVCLNGAISHTEYPAGSVNPIITDQLPAYDQVLELIRSRRSRRAFKEKPVEKDLIQKVLEAARFAPSAHNEQSTEFVVVQDKALLHQLVTLTSAYLDKIVRQLRNPITRTLFQFLVGRELQAAIRLAPDFDRAVAEFKSGKDSILQNAPVLVLFYADRAATFAGVNANLALQNAALAGEALGLACFYTGYLVAACDRDKSIAKRLSLPQTHKIYGGLAMGYPKITFKKWMERKPVRAKWMDA